MIKAHARINRNCLLFFLLFTTFSVSTIPLSAQRNSSDSLLDHPTLPAVIQYALKRQPQIQQALVDEQTTALEIKSKLADWYPQLNFGYQLQHNFKVQTSVIGGNPVRLGVNNTSALQFTASQLIFNRDVLLARRTRTDVLDLSRQQTENIRVNLAALVSKAFYDVLTTRQQLQVSDENIARLERSLKDAKAQFDAGIKDKTDYKRATIALNNAKATKSATADLLTAKQEVLKTLINYPPAATLDILYDSLQLEKEVDLDLAASPDFSKRVEFTILETQRKLAEANILYNKWSYLPSLSANGAYNYNFLNNDFGKLYSTSYPNSYAGLTLSVPIFQGGKRKFNLEQARWELKRIDLDKVRLSNQFSSEYSSAMAGYKANYANYQAQKENMALAQEVYDVINLQYRSGIKTYLEVISAETDLRTSRINYFNALYEVLSSKIDVLKSMGALTY